MANLFDLLHLANGESGAAAVSVLVAKTKHEEAEAATRLPASRAVDEANDRRREADQGKKAPGPTKLCFIAVNAKAQEKKNLVDEQIKLVKEQRKLLEEQVSLLEKQRKMSEEQGEDVDEQQAARTRLMDEQIKLKEGQRRLKEEQIKLWEGRNRLSEELGEYDVKGRAKEFSQEQKKFKEDLAKYLEEEKNFWAEQRRMGRWYADYRRGISGSGNGYYANGNGNDHQYNYNGNNGSGGYGRGNRNGHRYSSYNGNGGYGQDLSYGPYQQELYGHGEFNYDERQRHNYSGERQGHRGGKARRQNWQRKDRAMPDAAERSNTEEQQAVSASSETTEQKADAVDGRQQAVPASVSEISTGDGKGFAWAKRNGSQKRKMKRNSGNETDKAKRDSTPTVVDVWKKQTAATEPKTSSFEEEKKVTLDEYEKVREERKKSLAATAAAARRLISAEEFEGLQLLDKKKNKDDEEGEAVKMADKVKRKEKAERVQMGGTAKEAMPDPKKVADALFKHAPRPRRQYDQNDRYNRLYDGGGFQGARGDNSGRGDGAPAPRGGYSSGGRGGYSRRGRGGYQQQGGRGNGRFQVQQRDQLNAADFPALPGTAPVSAPPPSG